MIKHRITKVYDVASDFCTARLLSKKKKKIDLLHFRYVTVVGVVLNTDQQTQLCLNASYINSDRGLKVAASQFVFSHIIPAHIV